MLYVRFTRINTTSTSLWMLAAVLNSSKVSYTVRLTGWRKLRSCPVERPGLLLQWLLLLLPCYKTWLAAAVRLLLLLLLPPCWMTWSWETQALKQPQKLTTHLVSSGVASTAAPKQDTADCSRPSAAAKSGPEAA